MTFATELAAITPTANAKAVLQTKAGDVATLQALVAQHVAELKIVLKALIALHPSGGGDAANLTALNTILGEIA